MVQTQTTVHVHSACLCLFCITGLLWFSIFCNLAWAGYFTITLWVKGLSVDILLGDHRMVNHSWHLSITQIYKFLFWGVHLTKCPPDPKSHLGGSIWPNVNLTLGLILVQCQPDPKSHLGPSDQVSTWPKSHLGGPSEQMWTWS